MCTKIYLHVTVNTTICAPVYHKLVAQSILVSGCSGQEQSKQLLPVKAGVRKMHCSFPPLRPHSPGSVLSEWRQTCLLLTNRGLSQVGPNLADQLCRRWQQLESAMQILHNIPTACCRAGHWTTLLVVGTGSTASINCAHNLCFTLCMCNMCSTLCIAMCNLCSTN